jgi:hypothetical protein
MGDPIDPDQLIDSQGVADLLGLANGRVVSVLRGRHDAFPAPVVDMGQGRCLLWDRRAVESWAQATGRL